jgi:hypothetical protein
VVYLFDSLLLQGSYGKVWAEQANTLLGSAARVRKLRIVTSFAILVRISADYDELHALALARGRNPKRVL